MVQALQIYSAKAVTLEDINKLNISNIGVAAEISCWFNKISL